MKILVTGAAGYIGSHTIKNLLKTGFSVVGLDNLSTGSIRPTVLLKENFAADVEFEFIKGDLADKDLLKTIFQKKQIEAVIHLAAKIDATESVEKPSLYYQENYLNGINLVEAMTTAGVDKLIFSSTASVYGNPKYTPIDENHPIEPLNPYGQTKLDFEKYLAKVRNLKFIILRYFNVGGSDPTGLLGRSHLASQDLIENVFKVALGQKEVFEIFGIDYDTPDGTAIRDFIHVEDIVQAHVLSLENIEKYSGRVFNLGSEQGFSVKEIVDKVSLIIGKEIPTVNAERRKADIAVSVASAKKAKEVLGWNPQYSDLDSIIRTDWNWRKKHPNGYQ